MDEFSGGILRSLAAALSAVLLLTGCETLGVTSKVKNPVVPPPPVRFSEPESAGQARAGSATLTDRPIGRDARAQTADGWKSKSDSGKEVLTAWQSTTETQGGPRPVQRGEVAATVNGVPVFADDVLLPFAQNLERAKAAMPPEAFRQQRRALIAKLLPTHIEQELLLQALKAKISKEEQLTQIQKHIDSQFDEELKDTMKNLGVSTVGELEVKLRDAGSSVATLRSNFRNRRLAQQYLSMRVMPRNGFDRPDLVAYYQEHARDYAVPAKVKWQQIQLGYEKHGGKRKTQKLARQLIARIESGQAFAQLAQENSDGPTASNGGHWDWTTQGSMKLKELDQALFEMPVGDAGALIEGLQGIEIVCVHDRRDAGTKSFESVQADIKETLRKNEFQRSVEGLLRELRAGATIEDYTDRL